MESERWCVNDEGLLGLHEPNSGPGSDQCLHCGQYATNTSLADCEQALVDCEAAYDRMLSEVSIVPGLLGLVLAGLSGAIMAIIFLMLIGHIR